ncbi:PH domain-containing protein [Roseimaritima ulvae]|uniref:Bacterial membrane flanked domain protein n=1 Tax=Roseimaritima ulvae TaxID=980254 RepID=A0A5B9QKY3_9BACT|nr:PH domain-containing protein [Roseimaritima ulvae]QEG39748.1 Bacterial membrane flanked domain protein [Roseimaritima ulvae]
MQVLTAHCPYCHHEVDTTIEHLDGPVVCPSCEKPFEMQMPTATVNSVREVKRAPDEKQLAGAPDERVLAKVHPVVFRARPLASLALAVALTAAVAGLLLPWVGYDIGGAALIGQATLLTIVCLAALVVVAGVVAYWWTDTRFTTLTVTDDRTIYQRGLISRETSEVQHDDVRNIQLDQSFLQRLLNVGGIGISSSGQDDLEVVAKRLPNPSRIIDLVRRNQE